MDWVLSLNPYRCHFGWVEFVRSDLTHFQLNDPYQTYMVGRWYTKDDAHLFFGVKGQRSRGQKHGFQLKSISSFSYLARAFKFSECVVLTMAEISLGTEFWFRAPKNFPGGSQNGQNYELFLLL